MQLSASEAARIVSGSVEGAYEVSLTGAEVGGRFLRSSNSRDDFDFTMDEVAPGEYRATFTMPLHGLWDLVLQVRRGDDLH